MRIDLPSTAWTETLQRAQDDAHTLTLPPTRPVTLTEAWLAPASQDERFTVAVPLDTPPAMTLTF